MKRYAVIGHPLGHSFSPLLHSTAFKLLGIDAEYEKLDIPPQDLGKAIDQFRLSIWGGCNVTTPFKADIIPFLDKVEPEAETIQSVNTVINRGGMLIGTNTDIVGLYHSLQAFNQKIDGENCIVLGAGGVAGSVFHVLQKFFKPNQITLVARSMEKADVIRKRFSTSTCPITIQNFSSFELQNLIVQSTLIVNCTTVGMYPNTQNTPLPGVEFGTQHLVYDLIYRPHRTLLLQQAASQGAAVLDGVEMFIRQAAAAFNLWTGKDMPIPEIRKVLEQALST